MNRRDVMNLVGSSAMFASGIALAEKKDHKETSKAKSGGLLDALMDCEKNGLICEQLCVDVLSTGDKSMAKCMATVRDMLTLVRATAELAAAKSTHLGKVAALCAQACETCKKACDDHAEHHKECKNCARCCEECAKECKKIAA